jgi:hypothetical protein
VLAIAARKSNDIFYYRDEDERRLVQIIMDQRAVMHDLHTRLEEVHDIASAACIDDYGTEERLATEKVLRKVIFIPQSVPSLRPIDRMGRI